MLKTYYRLTKPGIVYGNLLTVAAGFLLASQWHINLYGLLAVLVGMGLVMASACVFNNFIDQGIDKKMSRTKKRALVSGKVSSRDALIYGTALGAAGFLVIGLFTNLLALITAAIGWFFYVIIYSYTKRRSVHGTLIGAIPGATPPVAGYLAVTNHFTLAVLLLFLVLVFWQMPHFYAIAMFRYDDYKAAGLPVWPLKKGMRSTKIQILLYIFLFIFTVALFGIFNYVGWVFLIALFSAGIYWLWRGLKGFTAPDDVAWGRKMFGLSLVVLLLLCLMLSINPH